MAAAAAGAVLDGLQSGNEIVPQAAVAVVGGWRRGTPFRQSGKVAGAFPPPKSRIRNWGLVT